ncbi:hypothetical protein SK803_04000 [Lentzea sp. BCCO 10_0856]|uniref:Uncharacterized protein n=1 Tax=Lentzea miocenica TaxID=3095431 RepID=A0ABU4STW9_9PSEU|nr:hypothetical protein [Lentzea sp. BCCO 10_0856]MDX8029356.1 hypothetical protein [Lentzea sp. BCCO 10_0856]
MAAFAAALSLTAVLEPQAGAADLTGWAVGFLPMPEGYPARAHMTEPTAPQPCAAGQKASTRLA